MAKEFPQPEQPKAPEAPSAPEQSEGVVLEQPQAAPTTKAQPQSLPDIQIPQQSAPAAAPKSETLEKIEDIMEEDLKEVFTGMDQAHRQAFKTKGEQTAEEIEEELYHIKVKDKKIFRLLFGWLKLIPGVNKYFLKQEAKIKTDEIMEVKDEIDRSRKDLVTD